MSAPEHLTRDLMEKAGTDTRAATLRTLDLCSDAQQKHSVALAAVSAALGIAAGTHYLVNPTLEGGQMAHAEAVLDVLRQDIADARAARSKS